MDGSGVFVPEPKVIELSFFQRAKDTVVLFAGPLELHLPEIVGLLVRNPDFLIPEAPWTLSIGRGV
jgi:hypothetical protein